MNYLRQLLNLITITYSLKKRKHEEYKASENFERDSNEQWFVAEAWKPKEPFSIHILSHKNHPIMQGLEAFSKN